MNNKTNKVTTIIIILISIVFLIFGLAYTNLRFKKEQAQLVPVSDENVEYDEGNRGLYAQTGTEEDSPVNWLENDVVVYDIRILAENDMPTYGITSLEGYLLRYLNYYLGEGVYTFKIKSHSFNSNQNFPSFEIVGENNDYTIECTYNICDERYIFYCKEIEQQKEEAKE